MFDHCPKVICVSVPRTLNLINPLPCSDKFKGNISNNSRCSEISRKYDNYCINDLSTPELASYPGSRGGGGKREPGTDRVRMSLIYQHSSNAVYHLDTFHKLRKCDIIKSVCRVKFIAFAIDIHNYKHLHVRTYILRNETPVTYQCRDIINDKILN